MSNLPKVFSVLLLGALTVTLAACGGQSEPAPVEESAPPPPEIVEPDRDGALEACKEKIRDEVGNSYTVAFVEANDAPQSGAQSRSRTDQDKWQWSFEGSVSVFGAHQKVFGAFVCEITGDAAEDKATYEGSAAVELDGDPDADPIAASFECSNSSYKTIAENMSTFEEAWALEGVANCHAKLTGKTLSPIELEAVTTAAASADKDEIETLELLYGICANPYPKAATQEYELNRTRAAAVLCPNHPRVDVLNNGDTVAFAEAQARAEGKFIGPGKYFVGSQIQAGTWVTTKDRVEDCYWEIADSQGNIIDNNFISLGGQISVYLPAGTGFTAERCGTWQWQGE